MIQNEHKIKQVIENMAKKKTTESDKIKTKQMKVFLNLNEHAIVTMAANLKGMHVRDYMKRAAVEQAKKDVKEVNKIIDSL